MKIEITEEYDVKFGLAKTEYNPKRFTTMTVKTNDGSYIITADEIIAFIKARNNRSKAQELVDRLKEIEKELSDSKAPTDLRLEQSAIESRLDSMVIEKIMVEKDAKI